MHINRDKQVILIWVGVFIIAVGTMQLIGSLRSKSPSFYKETVKRLKKNKVYMDSIGGYSGFSFTEHAIDANKDTINFAVEVNGHRRDLRYQGTAIRMVEDTWKIVDSTILIVP